MHTLLVCTIVPTLSERLERLRERIHCSHTRKQARVGDSVSPTRPVPPSSSSSSSSRVCTTMGVTPSRRWVNGCHILRRCPGARRVSIAFRVLFKTRSRATGRCIAEFFVCCRFIVVGVYRLQKARRDEKLVGSTPCDEASAFTPRKASRCRAASTAPRYSSRPLCAASQFHS